MLERALYLILLVAVICFVIWFLFHLAGAA